MGLGLQLIVNGLATGTSHGLLALSFALIYGTTRFFHLAHAAVYTIGAYAAFYAATSLDTPRVVAIAIGAATAAAVGVGVEAAVYRPLRSRHGSPLVLLMASIGVLVVLQNCVSIVFGDAIKTMPGLVTQEGYAVLSARITGVQLTSISVSLAAFAGVHLVLRKTWWGRRLRAVVDNESLARAVGIDARRVVFVSFAVGSMLAGLAASLAAYDTGLRPMMGFNGLLLAVVAMVIGGVGNVSAAFLGGLIVGAAQQVAALLLPTKWQDAVVFVLLVGFLLVRPQGVLGARVRKATV